MPYTITHAVTPLLNGRYRIARTIHYRPGWFGRLMVWAEHKVIETYVGSGTVWCHGPTGRRCPSRLEARLTEVWQEYRDAIRAEILTLGGSKPRPSPPPPPPDRQPKRFKIDAD